MGSNGWGGRGERALELGSAREEVEWTEDKLGNELEAERGMEILRRTS